MATKLNYFGSTCKPDLQILEFYNSAQAALTLATFCHENASNDPQLRPALPFSADLTQKGFFFFFLLEQLSFPRMIRPGNTKGGSITVLLTSCLTGLESTDNFCFYLKNRLIQTSQTGGQQYSDTSPLSIPWLGQ